MGVVRIVGFGQLQGPFDFLGRFVRKSQHEGSFADKAVLVQQLQGFDPGLDACLLFDKIEGLLIGAAGGLMGLGLGFVLTFAAEHFGIRMNPEVYYIDKLPVHLDPTEFALVGAATVVVCLAATLFPAYQASRVRPVDALRYD